MHGKRVPKSSEAKLKKLVKGRIKGGDGIGDPFLLEMIERQLVDEALRESEKRFRHIVFSLAGWIWEFDRQFTYTYCSGKVQTFLGFSPDEIMGKTFLDVICPEEIEKIRGQLVNIIDEKRPIEDMECWVNHKEGGRVCLIFNGIPVLDEVGNLIGYRGVAKDITQQKHAEEEREKLIAELEAAISKIKALGGLIPICASCKKIRDDKGYWNKLEAYIENHSEAEFSHGICPECASELYPEYRKKKQTSNLPI